MVIGLSAANELNSAHYLFSSVVRADPAPRLKPVFAELALTTMLHLRRLARKFAVLMNWPEAASPPGEWRAQVW